MAVAAGILAAEAAGDSAAGAKKRITDAGYDIEDPAYQAFIDRYFASQ